MVSIINRRPHPNAAAMFVNWLLSREGQTNFVTITQQSTRRLDAPKGPDGTAPDPKAKYQPSVNSEQSASFMSQAQQIAKDTLK